MPVINMCFHVVQQIIDNIFLMFSHSGDAVGERHRLPPKDTENNPLKREVK